MRNGSELLEYLGLDDATVEKRRERISELENVAVLTGFVADPGLDARVRGAAVRRLQEVEVKE